MKATICSQLGESDVLKYVEIILPAVEKDQILIEVCYGGVNFLYTLATQDKYQFKPPLPFSPGGEISGIVIATGNEVKTSINRKYHWSEQLVQLTQK